MHTDNIIYGLPTLLWIWVGIAIVVVVAFTATLCRSNLSSSSLFLWMCVCVYVSQVYIHVARMYLYFVQSYPELCAHFFWSGTILHNGKKWNFDFFLCVCVAVVAFTIAVVAVSIAVFMKAKWTVGKIEPNAKIQWRNYVEEGTNINWRVWLNHFRV